MRWLGHTLRAEADVEVDPTLSVAQAHDIAHHAERHLVSGVRRLTSATIHISPAGAHQPPAGRSTPKGRRRTRCGFSDGLRRPDRMQVGCRMRVSQPATTLTVT